MLLLSLEVNCQLNLEQNQNLKAIEKNKITEITKFIFDFTLSFLQHHSTGSYLSPNIKGDAAATLELKFLYLNRL
jgi:hypothetical protein